MGRVLIAYSTVDGQTLKISQALQRTLAAAGHQVTLAEIRDAAALDLKAFDKVVVGASVRYGHHRPEVADFVRAHRTLLTETPSAFFSVNVVARKPGRDRPDANPYVRKFLRQVSWQPPQQAVFAGRLDFPSLGTVDRLVIRLIMWLTRGPTDPTAVVEFTDWAKVEAFARALAEMPA